VFLVGVDLSGFNLTGAILTGTNLTGVDLTRANLTGANLTDAILTGVDLTRANLTGANLTGANFTGANLSRADLTGANLTGANFIGANLTGAIGLPPPPPQPPQAHEGVAYEIHNLFDTLNLPAISEFLNNYNTQHPEVNPNTQNTQIPQVGVFDPLLIFISKSALFQSAEKTDYIEKLTSRILVRVYNYPMYNGFRPIFTSVITFVCKQGDTFIEQYIRIYVFDCLNAYSGMQGDSCTKGMLERVIITLNTLAGAILIESPENQLCRDIYSLFPNINYTETVQEWCEKYLEDGPNNDVLKALTPLERREHFINFMKQKYGRYITESIKQLINRDAVLFVEMGVFERMAMGVRHTKKRRHPRKRGVRQSKKKRGQTKKRRKSKKRSSKKRRQTKRKQSNKKRKSSSKKRR